MKSDDVGKVVEFPGSTIEVPKTLKDWPWEAAHMDINEPIKDTINPGHYKRNGIECIQLSERLSFCLGNVVKYIFRFDQKGGLEDLKKARWYLDREISRLEGGESVLDGSAPYQGQDGYHGGT